MSAYRQARPGQVLRTISHQTWNAIVDAAKTERGLNTKSLAAAIGEEWAPTIALCRNDTGYDLEQGYVVKLTDPIIEPADNESEFLTRLALIGVETGDSDRDIGITLEPIADGAIGRVGVCGYFPAKLSVFAELDGEEISHYADWARTQADWDDDDEPKPLTTVGSSEDDYDYVQDSDPGAVGHGKTWLDTSDLPNFATLKRRNLSNTDWDVIPALPERNIAVVWVETEAYVVDEDGNQVVDEDGNFVVADMEPDDLRWAIVRLHGGGSGGGFSGTVTVVTEVDFATCGVTTMDLVFENGLLQ